MNQKRETRSKEQSSGEAEQEVNFNVSHACTVCVNICVCVLSHYYHYRTERARASVRGVLRVATNATNSGIGSSWYAHAAAGHSNGGWQRTALVHVWEQHHVCNTI